MGGSVGEGQSSNHAEASRKMAWDGVFFKILSIKIVHSGVHFILFCTVNWLDVEGLDIEIRGLTSEVGDLTQRNPSL